jgi:hypothetical protein
MLAALTAVGAVSAAPKRFRSWNETSPNPFEGKKLFANPLWAEKLEPTYAAFKAAGDETNAAKVRTIQKTGTFVWVSDRAGLRNIDVAIEAARAEQKASGVEQIVGLVLYNLPDRDCSAGESAGELSSAKGGLELYKNEFIRPYAEKVSAAKDLTFAIVLEPDSLGNAITNMGNEFCAQAAPVYEEGIAYAIANLQFPNVHLYIDAAHGGWLGWDDNLPLGKHHIHRIVSDFMLTLSRSRRRVCQGRPPLRQQHQDPRLRDQRIELQPLPGGRAGELHRVQPLLGRVALRLLARALSRGRGPAVAVHRRPGPRRAARRPRRVGRVVQCRGRVWAGADYGDE